MTGEHQVSRAMTFSSGVSKLSTPWRVTRKSNTMHSNAPEKPNGNSEDLMTGNKVFCKSFIEMRSASKGKERR